MGHNGYMRGVCTGGEIYINSFKKPVIIANTGYRKGLSRKLGYGKIAALFLHIPTSRGDRPASPPDFSASRFSRNFSDLETPIYRAPLYETATLIQKWFKILIPVGTSGKISLK
jgi:hypothetical protein